MSGLIRSRKFVSLFQVKSAASERPHAPLLCFLVFGVLTVCLVFSAKLTIHQSQISVLPDCEILCLIQFQSLLM